MENVNLEWFFKCGLIAEGSFGKVYLVKDLNPSQTGNGEVPIPAKEYALKVQLLDEHPLPELAEIKRDIHAVGNGELVALADYIWKDSIHSCILMDRYICGLDMLLGLKTLHICYIAHEMGRSISYLHEMGFLHRGINPGNFLVTHDMRIKLSGFGISCKNSVDAVAWGTHGFAAPDRRSSEKSDWFSFGCVIYYLYTQDCFWDRRIEPDIAKMDWTLSRIPDSCMQKYVRMFLDASSEERKTYSESLKIVASDFIMNRTRNMAYAQLSELDATLKPMQCYHNPPQPMDPVRLDFNPDASSYTFVRHLHPSIFNPRDQTGRFVSKKDRFPTHRKNPKGYYQRNPNV